MFAVALTPRQEAKKVLGDNFEIVLAFSREGPKKVYVQHRLKEYAKEVNALLEKKAYFYVCGDAANMAREVNTVLAQIISTERGIPETKAEEVVKQMRASNQYQVRLRSLRLLKRDPLLTLSNRRMCGHKQAGVQWVTRWHGARSIRIFASGRSGDRNGPGRAVSIPVYWVCSWVVALL